MAMRGAGGGEGVQMFRQRENSMPKVEESCIWISVLLGFVCDPNIFGGGE